MSRKKPSFVQLIRYINDGADRFIPPIEYNLESHPEKAIAVAWEFLQNAKMAPKRKNGNLVYHEIMSFSPEDATHIRKHPEILSNLAYRYLQWRTKWVCKAYARIHISNNIHIHFMISANNDKWKKIWFYRKDFLQGVKELEIYQHHKYPELDNSLVYIGKKERQKLRKSVIEQERNKRLNKEGKVQLSIRENLRILIEWLLELCISEDDFKQRLRTYWYEFYLRGKTPWIKSIETGKKYRLRKLGLTELLETQQKQWSRLRGREIELSR